MLCVLSAMRSGSVVSFGSVEYARRARSVRSESCESGARALERLPAPLQSSDVHFWHLTHAAELCRNLESIDAVCQWQLAIKESALSP